MFHWFKKIYFVPDQFDTKEYRIGVISKQPIDSLSQKLSKNQVLFYASDWQSLFSTSPELSSFDHVFNFLKSKEEKIYIVCDKLSLSAAISAWLQILLRNPNKTVIASIIRSYFFRYEMFYMSFNEGGFSKHAQSQIDFTRDENVDSQPRFASKSWKDLCAEEDLSVEFLLANYLYSAGSTFSLKESICRLLKKDLEKYLYELKEIMLVHLLQKRFIAQFSLEKDHTLSNFQDIILSQHPSIQVFFDPAIWNVKGMALHSAGKNVNFSAINKDHIEAMKIFNEFAAGEWGEEAIYRYVKSDVNKLEFISFLQTKDDVTLKKLIEVESQFTNAAGSFFSIDLMSVNHYLINYLFNISNQEKKENLANYITW